MQLLTILVHHTVFDLFVPYMYALFWTVISTKVLNMPPPLQYSIGCTNDISSVLRFSFWKEIYYCHDNSDFPSERREDCGHFVCIAENIDHIMTYKMITSDKNKVIFWFINRLAFGSKSKSRALTMEDTSFKRKTFNQYLKTTQITT